MIRLSLAAAAVAIALSPFATQAANARPCSMLTTRPAFSASDHQATLSRVEGVKAVQVAEVNANSSAVATVTFDDARADVPKLIAAVTNAGYPAHLKN